MSNKEHIAALKAAADPDRVAAGLGLRRGPRGPRFFCPVCQPDGGKSPDLAVKGGGFACFKCGLKGDLLKLVEVTLGLDFPKAVAWLEDLTGIPSPGRKQGYHGPGKVPIRPPAQSWGPVAGAGRVKGPETGSVVFPAVHEAFLAACRPVEGAALDWLVKDKGIAPIVVADLGLRFCGREYRDVMDGLKTRFGEDALAAAGLLKPSKKAGRLVPSFWHYFASEAGFLVIPYLLDGRPVFLKARPPCGKDKAERLGLVRFLNTSAAIPCLYNVDALAAQPDKVLICEGESDTWTALSCGFPAVGVPGAGSFKDAWVSLFAGFVTAGSVDEERAAISEIDGGLSKKAADLAASRGLRSTVYLALDADKAGGDGSRIIADLFLKAGLPIPLKLPIPAGMDLTEYMKEGKTA